MRDTHLVVFVSVTSGLPDSNHHFLVLLDVLVSAAQVTRRRIIMARSLDMSVRPRICKKSAWNRVRRMIALAVWKLNEYIAQTHARYEIDLLAAWIQICIHL